jgi:hypothetical protein
MAAQQEVSSTNPMVLEGSEREAAAVASGVTDDGVSLELDREVPLDSPTPQVIMNLFYDT